MTKRSRSVLEGEGDSGGPDGSAQHDKCAAAEADTAEASTLTASADKAAQQHSDQKQKKQRPEEQSAWRSWTIAGELVKAREVTNMLVTTDALGT